MLRKCLPFSNVVANGLATIDFRSLFGYNIDRIILKLGGTALTKAMLTAIQLKANAKLIYDDTGSRVDTRMQYRGIAADAAFLTLDFAEIRSKTIIGQKLGSIDTTFGIQSLTGEITIAGATAPTLEAWAEVDVANSAQPIGERALIAKVLNYNQNIGAAGKFPLSIPYGAQGGSLIKRLHLFGSNILDVEVKKNGLTVHESVDAVNDFIQKEYQRVPQANVYTLDFVVDGNQSGVLNAANANSMEYYVTTSGAGNISVVAELLDPLQNN